MGEEMGILSKLGITSEPVTTVTNLKTGGFYRFYHLRYDIAVAGAQMTITHKKGRKKGKVEKMSILKAAQEGYIWGSEYF
ncbi:MAG: hypothetical protein ACR2P3_05460 [Geminicoccaceae bacterium]